MFKVLFITFSGIALGYLLRRQGWVEWLYKGISYTIWLLLFFFGLQVGANEQVVANLDTLGLKALAISLSGVLGSCCFAWIVYRFVFSKGGLPIASAEGENAESVAQAEEKAEAQTQAEAQAQAQEQEQATAHVQAQDAPHPQGKFSQFMGGFIVVAFFALGCVCGWLGFLPDALTDGDFSMYVLYLLMIQVGISIGSDKRLKEILAGIRPKLLLLPLGTIVGTLLFVSAVSLALKGIGRADCMAVGAGFGYYSLSSVLITQIKEPSIGVVAAAQMGTIALMANIMREVMTLLFAPVICRVFGRLAPISAGGATSMDSTLPVIVSACGKEMAFISIFHGVLVDFSVPFLVSFFASL
ncbi:MAG: lysine exporter LysO family protein [Bacteroidales bacterium]|nr:lysine exporter LysO family protein [Bacteroidales bacterium]